MPSISSQNEPASKPAKRSPMKESYKKWSKPVIQAGFVIIPSVLFNNQKELDLTPLDLNILLQLASFWWLKKDLPMPTKQTLAERLGRDPSTIRRRIAALEGRGLIKRIERYRDHEQRANFYDLSGLGEALRPYAFEQLKKNKQRKQQRKGGEQ